MIDRDTSTWVAALDYLSAAKDAPEMCRSAAADALALYSKAAALHADMTARQAEERAALDRADRAQVAGLLIELRDTKRANLAAASDHVQALRDVYAKADRHARLAERLLVAVSSHARGGCLLQHQDALLQWIAQRRDSKPTTCGATDLLPDHVQFLYAWLPADWHQPFDENLTMHHHRRLALIYDDTWTVPYRASLTWLWRQVALGNVERGRNKRLYSTRRALDLPEVPPAKPTPLVPPVRPF